MNFHAFTSEPRPPRPWWATLLAFAVALFTAWHLAGALGRWLWHTH